jgi:hypothetical protein
MPGLPCRERKSGVGPRGPRRFHHFSGAVLHYPPLLDAICRPSGA